MTTANGNNEPNQPRAPAIGAALDTLMREYVPAAGAPMPATYADWLTPDPAWPDVLQLLYLASATAREGWEAAAQVRAQERASGGSGALTRLIPPGSMDAALPLAALAYFALERVCREAIATWTREYLAGSPGADSEGGAPC